MPEIVVHHLERSRSQRILWLLEELGQDYTVERYARDPETMRAPRALRDVHPLGKAPIVTIDGHALAESGAIIEHLTETIGGGRLRPDAPDDRVRYRFWLHYAEGSFMPPLLVRLIVDRLKGPPVPLFVRPLTRAIAKKVHAVYTDPETRTHLGFVERALAERTWLAGDGFSAADIQMSYPLEAVVARLGRGGADGGALRYPHIAAFVARIQERPAYRAAAERVGDFGVPG